MADLIKTDWFDSDVAPARVGVYEREYFAGPAFSLWDGAAWSVLARTSEAAAAVTTVSGIQHRRWRGVVPGADGCLPVTCLARNSCNGCAFATAASDKCLDSQRLLSCVIEQIVWRPRSEAQA